MPDEPTIGELSRRLDRFEERYGAERRSADARHLDAQVYVAERNHLQAQLMDNAADLASAVERLQRQVDDLKGRLTWAWRAALTGLVFPILVAIIAAAVIAYRSA
ncbi:MAG TPA: hypothetical protein VK735_39670 [Pseudonocardia sp.]|uniref:hypothetical protein n=1 Tax=Pseudonocardia sp. TaxID=60912 RepID=UPI002C3731B8|nr:hypothetical protein [Pseudonocardia sp.]HTF53602.1 hypothetical protein [Pseudonocardia sp.]